VRRLLPAGRSRRAREPSPRSCPCRRGRRLRARPGSTSEGLRLPRHRRPGRRPGPRGVALLQARDGAAGEVVRCGRVDASRRADRAPTRRRHGSIALAEPVSATREAGPGASDPVRQASTPGCRCEPGSAGTSTCGRVERGRAVGAVVRAEVVRSGGPPARGLTTAGGRGGDSAGVEVGDRHLVTASHEAAGHLTAGTTGGTGDHGDGLVGVGHGDTQPAGRGSADASGSRAARIRAAARGPAPEDHRSASRRRQRVSRETPRWCSGGSLFHVKHAQLSPWRPARVRAR
jgi:hypothetical protein